MHGPSFFPETAIFISGKEKNGRHLAFGSVTSLEKWSFKASVKHFWKCYTSELGSAKFLVLLSVKYCLDISFGRGIFRSTNLDVKWSIDALQCKVTVSIIAIFL